MRPSCPEVATNRFSRRWCHARRGALLLILLGAAAIPSCGGGDPPDDPPDEPIDLLETEPVGMGATGRFQVGHDGSANYVIPLRVPDGRRGVQPSIALSYNSNRSESGVGVGWSVSGGSGRSISRPEGRTG